MRSLRAVWLVVALANLTWADGGTVLFHQRTGDIDVTAFTKSDVVRAGANDLSVMVQGADQSTVMDATVLLRLEHTQSDGEIMRLTGIATHAKATNKMLYAATLNIPTTGRWRLEVEINHGGKSAVAVGEMNVLPPAPPMQNYWPFVAMVPLLGIEFFINRKLRERFRPPQR